MCSSHVILYYWKYWKREPDRQCDQKRTCMYYTRTTTNRSKDDETTPYTLCVITFDLLYNICMYVHYVNTRTSKRYIFHIKYESNDLNFIRNVKYILLDVRLNF